MEQNRGMILFILVICGVLLVLGCVQETKQTVTKKENPTIDDIVINPALYENETLILNGTYGTSDVDTNICCDKTAMKTRSDTLICGKLYCLYMAAGEVSFYPTGGIVPAFYDREEAQKLYNKTITINAIVRLLDGKPYFGN